MSKNGKTRKELVIDLFYFVSQKIMCFIGRQNDVIKLRIHFFLEYSVFDRIAQGNCLYLAIMPHKFRVNYR